MDVARIRTRFGFSSTTAQVTAGLDLTGRRIVVTGAASGLGWETSRALAAVGAEVTLAVRSLDAGAKAAAEIAQLTGNTLVRAAHLDLTDRPSIARFAAGWSGPLHVLVNNAGGILRNLDRTPEGWEKQFAVNHLGHFELANLLRPALAAGAAEGGEARIVSLSSSGHLYSPVVFDDVHFRYRQYADTLAYGQAKTANVLFDVGATARWAGDRIFANAAMPGPTLTGFQRNMDPERLRQRLGGADLAGGEMPMGFKTLEQGAATTVFLATSPLVSGVGGRYFEDSNEAVVVADNNGYRSGVAPYALNEANADRLWMLSEQLLSM
jgi:NAD(P)-dependent dehydrogenase (short-subunit alcohol dehydrogenase family)